MGTSSPQVRQPNFFRDDWANRSLLVAEFGDLGDDPLGRCRLSTFVNEFWVSEGPGNLNKSLDILFMFDIPEPVNASETLLGIN